MRKGKQLREKLTYANVMVTILAIIVLGGGVAYGASQLGKNSVGTKQLKKNSVTTLKIKNGAVTAAKVKSGSLPASVFEAGALPQGGQASAGTSAYYGFSGGPFSTSSNEGQAIIATVSLPSPGAYTLMADGFAYPSPKVGSADQVYCRLLGPGDAALAGMPSQLTLDAASGDPLVIVGAAELPQAGTVRLQCTQIVYDGEPDTITYIDGRIVATKVGSLVKG